MRPYYGFFEACIRFNLNENPVSDLHMRDIAHSSDTNSDGQLENFFGSCHTLVSYFSRKENCFHPNQWSCAPNPFFTIRYSPSVSVLLPSLPRFIPLHLLCLSSCSASPSCPGTIPKKRLTQRALLHTPRYLGLLPRYFHVLAIHACYTQIGAQSVRYRLQILESFGMV